MTTTPLSMDESLNGSWVDVNSPSQIHSPINSESSKYQRPPYSLAESVQHLGVISYQVEKLLQQQNELDRLSQGSHTNNNNNTTTISHADLDTDDNNRSSTTATSSNNNNNNSLSHSPPSNPKSPPIDIDYLSDSLSLVEAIFDKQEQHDTDWLWDWTAKPEYFSKEWKMQQPLKRSKLSLRQWALKKGILSREVVSLLFLTNILSIIIGAGITYSILVKRPLP